MSFSVDKTEPVSPAKKVDNTAYASMWKSK
ncbi:MAG: hypothetical protein H6Q72_3794 [Firmicutes bacterium]|nr:hypothetical protein [Bacillota bacterium]